MKIGYRSEQTFQNKTQNFFFNEITFEIIDLKMKIENFVYRVSFSKIITNIWKWISISSIYYNFWTTILKLKTLMSIGESFLLFVVFLFWLAFFSINVSRNKLRRWLERYYEEQSARCGQTSSSFLNILEKE